MEPLLERDIATIEKVQRIKKKVRRLDRNSGANPYGQLHED